VQSLRTPQARFLEKPVRHRNIPLHARAIAVHAIDQKDNATLLTMYL
jgi:hypothetical protein